MVVLLAVTHWIADISSKMGMRHTAATSSVQLAQISVMSPSC